MPKIRPAANYPRKAQVETSNLCKLSQQNALLLKLFRVAWCHSLLARYTIQQSCGVHNVHEAARQQLCRVRRPVDAGPA